MKKMQTGEAKKSNLFSGCIPDPIDNRDYDVAMAVEFDKSIELPQEYRVWTPALEDQIAGNCVAQVIAAICECVWHRQYNLSDDYSVGWIYGNKRWQSVKKTSGMIPREACASVVNFGDVLRKQFECLEEVPTVTEAFEAVYDSLKDTAFMPFSEYVSLNSLFKIKSFIYTYKIPILVTVNAAEIYPFANGYHAILCYGWDKRGMLQCQNSWGDMCSFPELQYQKLENKWGLVPMAKSFNDIEKDAWYAEAIKEASEDNVLNGYPDGTFKPDKPITRAEMAAVYLRIKRLLFDDGGEK